MCGNIEALDGQLRLDLRWSHILDIKYHDVCLQFVIAVFPDNTHHFYDGPLVKSV